MKVFSVIAPMLVLSTAFAQGPSNNYAPPDPVMSGSDLTSRVIDLEVRQIILERRLKTLEEQLQQPDSSNSAQTNAIRMKPRHIEVLKKEQRTVDRQQNIPYPIYPIVPLQNGVAPSTPNAPLPANALIPQ